MSEEKTTAQRVQEAARGHQTPEREGHVEKLAGLYPEIIVTGREGRPYFEIKYYAPESREWYIGYSSSDLHCVFEYLEQYFGMTVAEPSDYGEKLPDCHARNNADRIRAMNDYELAAFLAKTRAQVHRDELRVIAYSTRDLADNLDWLRCPVQKGEK